MSIRRKIRYIYEALPFRQHIFSLVRKIWQPNDRLNNFLYFDGEFDVEVPGNGSFRIRNYGYGFLIENELFWRGLYRGHEKFSMELWTKLSEGARVVLDVGANTGIFSLITKTVNPEACVYAFDPVERVYEKLVENINLNGLDARCFKKALSDTDGKAVIYDLPSPHVYSVTVGENIHPADFVTLPTEIDVIRLDSFIESEKIEGIDLIKIDVETHEPQVLKGFGKYLAQFRPTILIEILNDEVGAQVEDLIKNLEYLYFNIDDVAGSVIQTTNIRKSTTYNYLLCGHSVAARLGLVS